MLIKGGEQGGQYGAGGRVRVYGAKGSNREYGERGSMREKYTTMNRTIVEYSHIVQFGGYIPIVVVIVVVDKPPVIVWKIDIERVRFSWDIG